MNHSVAMLRRNIRHAIRYPSLTFGVALVPVIMMLMFAYLFGNAISMGVAGATGGADYIDFLIASPKAFCCTEAAAVQPESPDPPAHDAFTRLLHRQEPDPQTLWQEARPLVHRRGVR